MDMRFIIAMLTVSLFATSAFATDDSKFGGPTTYSIATPDGKHLFVMIAPRPSDPDPDLNPEKKPDQKAIKAKYATSGLYRNDGSTEPLWTVDWYAYYSFPADDAIHVVRMHGDAKKTETFVTSNRLPDEAVAEQLNAPGLSFYERGTLLKTYTVRELVKNPDGLPHTMKHVLWSAGGVMTADGKKYCQMTQDQRQIFFDLETGKVLNDRAAGLSDEAKTMLIRVTLGVVGFAVVMVLGVYLYFGKSRKTAVSMEPET